MLSGAPLLIIGDESWRRLVRARIPAHIAPDESEAIPAAFNETVRLVIIQPDRIPSADFFAFGRRHGGVRWLCSGESGPPQLAAEIDWREIDDPGLPDFIATRIEQHTPNLELTPESDEFSRRIEDDVFFGLLINHANQLLKKWEQAITPGSREQGEGKCDDLGLKRHLDRLHDLLSNSIPLSIGAPAPALDSTKGTRLYENLYVSEKTVILARRHFPKNTCYQSISSVERSGLHSDTLVRCDDNFLLALLITILEAAPIEQIDSAEIDDSVGPTVRLSFPFEFRVPNFGSQSNGSSASERLEALAKVLGKYSAFQESDASRFTLIFQRQEGTP